MWTTTTSSSFIMMMMMSHVWFEVGRYLHTIPSVCILGFRRQQQLNILDNTTLKQNMNAGLLSSSAVLTVNAYVPPPMKLRSNSSIHPPMISHQSAPSFYDRRHYARSVDGVSHLLPLHTSTGPSRCVRNQSPKRTSRRRRP
jgi:hypothetical protein